MYIRSGEKRKDKINYDIITSIKENREVLVLSLASIALVILSLYNSIFGIAAFVLGIYAIIKLRSDKGLILLISLVPWAYIYKVSIIPTSLFSIVVFVAALKYLFDIKKVDTRYILLMILFISNVVMHFSMDTAMLLMFVKLVVNLLLLYEMCIVHKSENLTIILVFYIFSVLLSSIVALAIPKHALFSNRLRS